MLVDIRGDQAAAADQHPSFGYSSQDRASTHLRQRQMRNCAVSFGAALTMADSHISSAVLRAEGPRVCGRLSGCRRCRLIISFEPMQLGLDGSIVDASQEKFKRYVSYLTPVRCLLRLISEPNASVGSQHWRYGGCHGERKGFTQERAEGRTRPPRPRRSQPCRPDGTGACAAWDDAGLLAQPACSSSRLTDRRQRPKQRPGARVKDRSAPRLFCRFRLGLVRKPVRTL